MFDGNIPRMLNALFILLVLFIQPATFPGTATATGAIRGAHIASARIAVPGVGVADPCAGTPAVGTLCSRGSVSYANADVTKLALYAGTYAGSGTTYKYMVTPSHCGTAIPSTDTCDGTGDVAGDRMLWATAATTAATTQIIASPSAEYGGAQSATIAATAGSIAAKFCDSLKFGGYDDWYLPAMKTGTDCTDYSGEFYQVLYKNSNQYIPNNNVDCDASIVPGPLTGFSASRYLSSVEQSDDSTRAWALYFLDGSQINTGKTGNLYVRCIRRY